MDRGADAASPASRLDIVSSPRCHWDASPRLQTRGVTAAGGCESGEGKRAGCAGGGAEARAPAPPRGLPAVKGGRPIQINLMPIGEGAPVERCMGVQWGGGGGTTRQGGNQVAKGRPRCKKKTMSQGDGSKINEKGGGRLNGSPNRLYQISAECLSSQVCRRAIPARAMTAVAGATLPLRIAPVYLLYIQSNSTSPAITPPWGLAA